MRWWRVGLETRLKLVGRQITLNDRQGLVPGLELRKSRAVSLIEVITRQDWVGPAPSMTVPNFRRPTHFQYSHVTNIYIYNLMIDIDQK